MDLYAKSATSTTSSNDASKSIATSKVSAASVFVTNTPAAGAAAESSAAAASSLLLTSTISCQLSRTEEAAATVIGNHFPYSKAAGKVIYERQHRLNSNPNTNTNSPKMCSYGSQTEASAYPCSAKRKRRSTADSNDVKDPELGLEPPSAKRQQRLPTLYGSDQSTVSSVASSVYTSPVTDTQNAQELLSIRSSPADDLSEVPHSPLPDSPDSPPSPDRGAKQQPVVVRYVERPCVAAEADDEAELEDDSCEDYSFDEEDEDEEDDIDDDDDDDDSSATTCSQNGERTPAQQSNLRSSNSGMTINNNNMPKIKSVDDFMANNYKCMSPAVESSLRQCPLPALSWANAADVWKLMCKRDEDDSHLRSSSMLEQHPGLQPRMRAILLDWLIEVCEVYKLHRETFYLAVDYLDRYLHQARKVQKTHLQLIGITCLFVAAKVEEIYPPKIGEFAYVTDGACTEKDILHHEKLLLQGLGWDISPITVTGWLGVYMQLNVNNRTPASFSQIAKQSGASAFDDAFIYPQFSGFEFVQTSQLLDLCTLDVGMANFPYSVLAAAAISHTFSRETAMGCSGLDWQVIQPCARWMEPFFRVISKKAAYLQLNEQNEQVSNKFGLAHVCPNIVTDDSHIIQTHTTTMEMYDELLMAQDALHAMRARTQASPATALRAPENLLTPPASSHKPDDYLADEDETAAAMPTSSSNSASSRNSNIANRENIAVTGNSSRSSNIGGSRQ